MTIKAIIFDLDGTLLDTLEDIADSMNFALIKFNLPTHCLEKYKYFIGDGARELVFRSLPDNRRDQKTLELALKEFRGFYSKNFSTKTRIFPGIDKMLDSLQRMSIKMAILSNKPHIYTVPVAQKYFGNWHFEKVLGLKDDFPKKPDPTSTFLLIDSFGFELDEFLFVGDTPVDIQTAKNAGIKSLAVTWGHRTYQELALQGPDYLVDRPMDIINYL